MKTTGPPAIAVILLLCITFIQSCTQGKGEVGDIPRATDAVPVKVISVEKSTNSFVITASGKLARNDETTLGFKVAGILKDIFVDEGDHVKEGQVLAALDQTEIDAVVGQAMQSFIKTKRDFERTENLFRDSVATLEQVQNSLTAFEVASDQLALAVFNKDHAVIRALRDGFVLKKFVNPGQVVGIGDPVLTMNGASGRDWILKVGVNDKEWAVLEGNERAVITLDAFEDKIFTARVERKSKTIDPASGLFTVDLKLDSGIERMGSGMFGRATVVTNGKRESWAVPYEAVLDATGSDAFVFVTTDGKTAKKKPVTIRSFEQDHIALEEGLEENDQLIVSGSAYLSDNDSIEIINRK